MAPQPSRPPLIPKEAVTSVYRRGRTLGSGNFGVVYEAEKLEDGSKYALKVFPSDAVTDWEAEVKTLKKASSTPAGTRVVRMVDHYVDEEHDNCRCIVTTPVCEMTLQDLLESVASGAGPSYDLQTALRWASELADTLHLLHTTEGCRLYHGDLRPRNIFLYRGSSGGAGSEGLEAYIGDFGIALHNHPFGLQEEPLLYTTSSTVAPELMEPGPHGNGGKDDDTSFDARADVWSWGVVVYALLSKSMARVTAASEELCNEQRRFFLGLLSGSTPADEWRTELEGPWGGPPGSLPSGLLDLVTTATAEKGQRASLWHVRKVLCELRGLPSFVPIKEAKWLLIAEQELVDLRLRRTLLGDASQLEDMVIMLKQKARAHSKLGEHAWEEDCLREAVQLQRQLYQLAGDAPSYEDKQDLVSALHRLIDQLLQGKPRLEEALQLCEEAERVAAGEWRLLACAYLRSALCYDARTLHDAARQRRQAAVDLLVPALSRREKLSDREMEKFGGALMELENFAPGITCLELTVQMRQAKYGLSDPRTMTARMRLADGHGQAGDAAAALAIYDGMLAELGSSEADRISRAELLEGKANLHIRREELAEAKGLLEEALQLRRNVQGERHEHVAQVQASLASVSLNLGLASAGLGSASVPVQLGDRADEWDSFERQLVEALDIQREYKPNGHRDLLSTDLNIALMDMAKGDEERSLGRLAEALDMATALRPPAHPQLVMLKCSMALLTERAEGAGRDVEVHADVLTDEVVTDLSSHEAEAFRQQETPQLALMLKMLGKACTDRGDYARAREVYAQALKAELRHAGGLESVIEIALAMERIAVELKGQGEAGRISAIQVCEQAIAALEACKGHGQESEALGLLNDTLGQAYYLGQEFDRALQPLMAAALAMEADLGREVEQVHVAFENVGTVYSKLGNFEDAIVWWEQAAAMIECAAPEGVQLTEIRAKIRDAHERLEAGRAER